MVDPIGGDVAVGLLATLRPGGLLVTLKGRNPRLESAAAQRGVRLAFTYVTPDGAAMAGVAQLLGPRTVGIRLVSEDRHEPITKSGCAWWVPSRSPDNHPTWSDHESPRIAARTRLRR
ncbi:hypothetical protein [Micromonospora fulviviridis]|uniref:hypothetical protein n=1 Tax=Micromonospora fulviviridis TaxID=47860 RepID=UPI00166ADC3E|nr:hypothetical protein [Micromonospora fulviviridis]